MSIKSVSVDRAQISSAVHDGHGMRISQETFDAVVRENVDEFEMSPEEAAKDAVAQFQAQGVDLANICTDPRPEGGNGQGNDGGDGADGADGGPPPPIIAACQRIVEVSESGEPQELAVVVRDLVRELRAAENGPIVAGSNGAVQALVTVLGRLLDESEGCGTEDGDGGVGNADGKATAANNNNSNGDNDDDGDDGNLNNNDNDNEEDDKRDGPISRVLLATRAISLCMVVPYNREVLGVEGLENLLRVVGQHGATCPAACAIAFLAIARACVKDENNRQDLVERGAVRAVVDCLERHGCTHHGALRGACDAIVALTLGDDPRAALTKAHEHVRSFAHEGAIEALCAATKVPEMVGALATASSVLSALSKIAARNELCERIVALGGMDAVVALQAAHGSDARFARSACSLVRALAGNDDARVLACKGPALDGVLGTLVTHAGDPKATLEACGAVNSLALRNPANAAVIASRGGIPLLVQAMRQHPGEAGVQRYGASAIRHLVVRNPENVGPAMEEGVEELLRLAMERHPTAAAHAKGALRDLGCEVKFNEEWKGVRGSLERGDDK